MLKIAIDARFYGIGHTGLGRYTTNVLEFLPKYLQGYTLQVLLRDSEYDKFPTSKNVVKVHCEIPHYSLAEQLKLPGLLNQIGADLLYTLHFNTPIFSDIPTIITVHDLIKTHFTGPDTTTRSPWLYRLKRYGYNRVIQKSLRRASDIIVPTNTVKNDILAAFNMVKPERIFPIAEAPDEIFRQNLRSDPPASAVLKALRAGNLRFKLPDKYILFVGNAYPHKNLSVLLEAMKELSEYHLVIVAKQSPFLARALAPFDQGRIHIYSDLSDNELLGIYRVASMLVTPSLMEGYGLVGLEALMVGTPVVASNIPVYREVYGNQVSYFDPSSSQDLVRAIHSVGARRASPVFHFERSWDDVAKSIAEVINARCTRL